MDSKPNWQKWKHIPQLEIWQAIALSLNLDPDSMDRDSFDYPLESLPDGYKDRMQILAANLEADGKTPLKEGVQFHTGYPSFHKVRTAAFAAWANEIWPVHQIPEELKALAVVVSSTPESKIRSNVDWHHWRHMDQWDLSEAICMLLAIEPGSRAGTLVKDRRQPSSVQGGSTLLETWRKAIKIRDLAVASHKQGVLSPTPDPYAEFYDPRPMPPQYWLAWAARKGIVIPAELQEIALSERAPEMPQAKERANATATSDDSEEIVDQPEELHPRVRTTYLNTIGALLELLLARNVAGNPRHGYESEAKVIDALQEHYPNSRGIKERTLQETFAAAKRELKKE
jgi:hypothetical protein